MRSEAAQKIVPEFFETKVNDVFREQIKVEAQEARNDIATLQSVIDELGSQMSGESAADKLLARFFKNKNAATVLYFARLREQMRPGRQLVMEHAGRFLAPQDDGKLIVRESVKSRLKSKIARFHNSEKFVKLIQSEMKILADELLEKDELHSRLKQRMRQSTGACYVLAMSFDSDESLGQHVEQYLEDIEELFEDEPDGLVIREEAKPHLEEAMDEMNLLLQRMKRLKEPILNIANDIDVSRGEMERWSARD